MKTLPSGEDHLMGKGKRKGDKAYLNLGGGFGHLLKSVISFFLKFIATFLNGVASKLSKNETLSYNQFEEIIVKWTVDEGFN